MNTIESNIRSYSRSFPTQFATAKNDLMIAANGKSYIDFFAGAGALNYGHNNPKIKTAIIEHLEADRLIHNMDMSTDIRDAFLNKFQSAILKPRHLNYKIQFTGPTGTNAIEAALKLAIINQKRSNILCFTNAYHGHTFGALSLTGNEYYRQRLNIPMLDRQFMPFDGYLGEDIHTIDILRKMLTDKSSGVSVPAAIILETVQAEGGINVASTKWLQDLRQLCDDFGILMIADDIQVGNGRTGDFFSFEKAGIVPDIVVLSKSIGGGLPLSMVLMKPELDIWKPGEHTGTFRSNNLALAVSTQLLEYWEQESFSEMIKAKEQILLTYLEYLKKEIPNLNYRGRGLIYGIEISESKLAKKIANTCFNHGLIIETAGSENQVLKILPPLTITLENIERGLRILVDAIEQHCIQIEEPEVILNQAA